MLGAAGAGAGTAGVGPWKEAATDIKNAIKLLKDHNLPEHIWAHGLLALAQLRLGALADAYQAARAALATISKVPPVVHYCVEAYSAVAEVTVSLAHRGYVPPGGSPRVVQDEARRACGALRKSMGVFPIAAPKYWRAVGLQQRGSADATASWRKALAAAVKLEMPYDEALAHLLLARSLDDTEAQQRATHATKARELLEPMGARWALDLIEPTAEFPFLGRRQR